MKRNQSWEYEDYEELEKREQTPAPPLDDRKKNALLRYMAVLFSVAFLLVLLSFLIQMRDSRETISDLSQTNASALQNAGKLQENNQTLTQENADLREELQALEDQLTQAKADTERAEASQRETITENENLQKTLVDLKIKSGQLFEAAQYWILGERDRCERILDRMKREELDDQGQELYDQLRTSLAANTVENPPEEEIAEPIEETSEDAEPPQEEE